jgi:CO/xanthine dehydrogenase Mo-binding subunit
MPHARVRHIDTSAALAMPGVKAILTADDLPDLRGANARSPTSRSIRANRSSRSPPSPAHRRRSVQRIDVDLEPLPFVVDPVRACAPESNGRLKATCGFRAAGAPGASGRRRVRNCRR